MGIALIVDVESDWGRDSLRGVHEALPRLVALLERFGARATFFVVGELAGEVAETLSGGPHEVGSHGLTHRALDRVTRDEARFELVESRRRLEAAGFAVEGFRAPFLRRPAGLSAMLSEAGYAYDASLGALGPSLSNPATLRGGVLPFNLTWLRLLDPLGARLVPREARAFSLHLHELVAGDAGWRDLPAPLRRLHGRGAGARAWSLVGHVVSAFGPRLVPCREVPWSATSSSAPARRA